jgi:hypothetical protein
VIKYQVYVEAITDVPLAMMILHDLTSDLEGFEALVAIDYFHTMSPLSNF